MAQALGITIEMQEITRLLTTELRPKVDAVRANRGMDQGRQTGAGTVETVPGRAARAGTSSGQQCAIDGVEKVRLFILGNVMRPEELPNWDGAGGLN